MRFFGITFLGRARSELIEQAHEADFFMLLAMGLSSILVLVCGIYPLPVVQVVCTALKPLSDFVVSNGALAWNLSGNMAGFNPLLLLLLVVVVGGLVYLCTAGSCVEKDVTWNCGTYPTARQQYSATGFSKPVRRAF